MDTGPCRGNIPRWYFDRQSNQCLEFLYGGCQGNTNNFETREECQKSCASGTGQPDRQGKTEELLLSNIDQRHISILQVPFILWGIVPVTFWRIFLNLYGVSYVIYFFLTKMSIVYVELALV